MACEGEMRNILSDKHRLLGLWYLCIGAGFMLLGLARLLKGEVFGSVALRWVLSVGFFALAWFELRGRR